MSNLNAFIEHVQQDAQLQARLKEATSEEMLIERVLAEAKTLGYALDAGKIRQRLTAIQNEDADSSDAELAVVSGGGKTGYCITPYCPMTVHCPDRP